MKKIIVLSLVFCAIGSSQKVFGMKKIFEMSIKRIGNPNSNVLHKQGSVLDLFQFLPPENVCPQTNATKYQEWFMHDDTCTRLQKDSYNAYRSTQKNRMLHMPIDCSIKGIMNYRVPNEKSQEDWDIIEDALTNPYSNIIISTFNDTEKQVIEHANAFALDCRYALRVKMYVLNGNYAIQYVGGKVRIIIGINQRFFEYFENNFKISYKKLSTQKKEEEEDSFSLENDEDNF